MDLLIVTTASHRELADAVFRPSLPATSGATVLERRVDAAGAGDYGSQSWQQGVTAKLGYALDYMDSSQPGGPFILSDVDIEFFPTFSTTTLTELLDRSGADVLFQKEHRDDDDYEVNTGFYVARNVPWVHDLLGRALALCRDLDVQNDQVAVNRLLQRSDCGSRWGFLPLSFYARSQGFPPKGDIVLHHANFSGTIAEKRALLARVHDYVTGGRLAKLRSLAGEGVDFVRSGKLRLLVRTKIKG